MVKPLLENAEEKKTAAACQAEICRGGWMDVLAVSHTQT